jgi:hypothetical protein
MPSSRLEVGRSSINAVIYGVPLIRRDRVDLRWLDPRPRTFFATHINDTVVLEPVCEDRYVVTAEPDGEIIFQKPISERSSGWLHVHHHADGRICLRPGGWDDDEFPPGLSRRGIRMVVRTCDIAIVRFDDGFCSTIPFEFLPDSWDRTKAGLEARPRELRDAELRFNVGPERWAKIQAERERVRLRSAALREVSR